jgi:DNA-binding LacI/PurR family transcriptional regulator
VPSDGTSGQETGDVMPGPDATPPVSSRKSVTIYDVARLAGVAPSTVSRAFARPGRVNSETAARVRAAAAEIGYRVNPLARALSTARSQMIALVISDVTNPFYADLISGAQSAANKADYIVVLVDARESRVLEREALERTLPVVDGVVIGSSRVSDSTLQMVARQKPMIVLNRHLVGVPSVVTDNARGVRRALEHLVELGHRQLTYVAGPEASWADGVRWRAVREAGAELGVHTRRVGPVAPTIDGGRAAALGMIDGVPTAVLAYNDLVAIGMMLSFAAAGVRVPHDVSLVGFDNILPSGLVSPGLTTVAAPVRTMGTTAVTNMLAMIRGALPHNDSASVVPTRLVVRGSTGRPRR